MKLAHWIGDDVIKNRKTYPNHDVIDQKPQTQILKFFLILNYKISRVLAGFEQLSSSICCRVMADHNIPFKELLYLCQKCFFLAIILALHMLESQALKTRIVA